MEPADNRLRNALFDAVDHNDIDTLRVLKQEGADLNVLRSYFHGGRNFSFGHHSLLMRAQYKENLGMLQELITLGADLDQQNIVGETVLIQAVKDCANFPRAYSQQRGVDDSEMAERFIRALITAGADPFVKDKYGKTARDWAEGGVRLTMAAAEKAWLEKQQSNNNPKPPAAPKMAML